MDVKCHSLADYLDLQSYTNNYDIHYHIVPVQVRTGMNLLVDL